MKSQNLSPSRDRAVHLVVIDSYRSLNSVVCMGFNFNKLVENYWTIMVSQGAHVVCDEFKKLLG